MRADIPVRPEAEARIRNPDELAGGLRLVGAGHLAALLVLCLVTAAIFAGAVLVQVPLTVSGTGVVLSSKGVLEFTISADHEGRVVDMLVDVGQRVQPGQAIARIVQPNLQSELRLAQSELDLVTQEEARVRTLQSETTTIFQGVRGQQEATSRETIDLLNKRRALLEKLAEGMEGLRRGGNTTFEHYLQVHADLAEVLERIASERGKLLSLALDSYEKQAQHERELHALQTRRARAERQISRLQDRIANETVVRSTQYGIVSEMKVFPGDLIKFDTQVVSLLPVDESFSDLRPGGTRLVSEVFISAKDGKKLRPGMTALVEPSSVRRDVYGAIAGKVTRVSDVPASPEQLRQMLRNDELVRKLSAGGPPFLVTVEMERDPRTKSGYRWTTSEGPDANITAGTMVDARVQTERVTVLGLVLPALKEMLRGPVK